MRGAATRIGDHEHVRRRRDLTGGRGRLLATLALVFVLGGCSEPAPQPLPPLTSAVPSTAPPRSSSAGPATSISPFTGLPQSPGAPVLAVKIDNAPAARPQTGLDAADLVVVEPVEGGISRLLAVFSSRLPALVGPVRSVRESDLGLLGEFGRPVLAFSGAAPELAAAIRAAPVVGVSEPGLPAAFTHLRSRPAPHNTYARPTALLAGASGSQPARDIGLRFGPAPAGGTVTGHLAVRYSSAEIAVDVDPGAGRWLISADHRPLLTAGGVRLSAATVVVQHVPVRPSSIRDAAGAVSPVAVTVGAGRAEVLRDGMAYEGRWSRPTPGDATAFTLPSGGPLPFAGGPVWLVLAPA